MRISQKLVLGFAGVALLTGAVGYFSVDVSRKALQKAIGEHSLSLASDVLERIDDSIHRRIEELQFYCADPELRKAAAESNRSFEQLADIQGYISEKDAAWCSVDKETVTPFMENLIDNDASKQLRGLMRYFRDKYGYRVFSEIFLANKYGANVAETGKTTDYYQADEQWWQQAKEQGLYVSDVEYDQSSGVYSLTIGVRVSGENGDFLGAIKAVLDVEDAIRAIKESRKLLVPKTAKLMLFNREGKVIFDETGRFAFMDSLPGTRLLESMTERTGYSLVRDRPGGPDELLFYVHSRQYEGYKGPAWILVVEYEAKEVFAPVTKLSKAMLGVSAAMTLSAVLIGIVISRSISKRITRLKDGADNVSRGELDTTIKVDSSDELGQLAQSFNRMARNLAKDISRRAQTEEKLKDYQAKLKSMASTTWLREERERRRIARDLHDDIGQKLAVAKLELMNAAKAGDGDKSAAIEKVCSEIEAMLENVRFLTFEVSNPVLTELGLQAALERHLASEIRDKRGIAFELHKCPELPALDEDMSSCLFRSVRELLTNVVKHARAKTVSVYLDKVDGNVTVSVTDDGVGFNPAAVASGTKTGTGFGLFSIREQLEGFDGTLDIESAPGRGSRFTVTVPLPGKKET
jgi:signal transduction histidine kinase